ncbi:morphogenetic protein [Salmonella enterica]|nr:morphogenetic protein [Salmonella enterica]EBQ8819954.1 morphogenetic protein [Salmonella enterica subsp. enterica serovar Kisarawe]EBV7178463.1 morphogenetic protein [Salmonella enterica subsp. enterica serovar Thompson]ECE8260845.1 morphogenetic protein [Salmonella enterica subsp. enterica serovar Hvittingfoss]EDV4899534.1 morphogenetic protein [Salmonella enterica subsp. enterica]EHM5758483.1 morphogenetic protein [Salmonella enterica subsp. salamae serovar 16:m,t:-]EIT8364703.1 morphog
MLLPDFPLPSRPSEVVQFRQPNIADAMRFNKISPSEEEQQTSAYLRALLVTPEKHDVSKWTAQDRRTALWWIYTGSHDTPVETFAYTCRHCGQQHYYDCNMNDLAGDIQVLDVPPYIDNVEISVEGVPHQWRIVPLDGWAMEMLELRRAALPPEDAPEYEDELIDLRLWEFAYQCEIYHDVAGTRDEQAERRFEIIKRMAIDTEFMKLAAEIRMAQETLDHGLPCHIDKGHALLHLPAHKCPNDENKEPTNGLSTRLWVQFRPTYFIPQVGLERLSDLSIQPGFVWGYTGSGRGKTN